ncbi:MAG TPA: hypothetical protein VFO10_21985 [Oligoflexus sp.]|uniref:hypothetical protein n=1 Tax=Oligoflexus sp. TaxID=1971216 RepID=UPI002D807043|nr:hypothetical protein [Oligoflexus sp.]HET9239947.1 hypothetical protein [Oligoflexus sp.]
MKVTQAILSLLGAASLQMSCADQASELKAGRDIRSFQKLEDGSYAVVCKDGLTETVSEAALLSNKVCQFDKYPYVLKSVQTTFLFSEDGEQDNCLLNKDEVLRFGTQDQPLSVNEEHFLVPLPLDALSECTLTKALVLKSHVQLGRHVGSQIVWDQDAPEAGVSALFADPETVTSANAGALKLGPVTDIIPLSSGWILAGDSRSNKLVKINAITGKVSEEYQLTVAPGRMVLDEATGIVTIATRSANRLVRINLLTKSMETLALPMPAVDLAVAGQGQLFVTGNKDSFQGQILLLGRDGKVLKDWKTDRTPSALAYDKVSKNLFVFAGQLQRYTFDDTTAELTAQEKVDAGNVALLVLSPDGRQLAAPAGGGNGNGYSVFDFNPQNLKEKNGEWNVGAYPSGAAFFTKKDLFAAHNRETIKIFSKTTHALIKDIPIRIQDCSYGDAKGMAVSRQENLVFVVSQCGFDRDSGTVFWAKLD